MGSLLPQHLWEGTKCNIVDVTSVALYLVGWEGLKGHLTKDLSVAILAQDPCGATSKRSTPALQIGSSWGVVVMAVLHGWPGFAFRGVSALGPPLPGLPPFRASGGRPRDSPRTAVGRPGCRAIARRLWVVAWPGWAFGSALVGARVWAVGQELPRPSWA